MKSEHRHELKTNELAEWLNSLPLWCKNNLSIILFVIAVIIIVGGFFGWRYYTKNIVQTGEQEQFTRLMDDILNTKLKVVSEQMTKPGSDLSYLLSNEAKKLKEFAQSIGNKNIAAFALIKSADLIRAEFQYRPETVSKEDLTEKINEAKKLYTEANGKLPSDNTIMALASFGLGLCEEELGNFDEAEKIYKSILNNVAYQGTVVIEEVNLRLNAMSDYKNNIVFLPAPKPVTPDANAVLDPLIQQLRDASKKFSDANTPHDTNLPAGINTRLENKDTNSPASAIEPNITNVIKEANLPGDINSPK